MKPSNRSACFKAYDKVPIPAAETPEDEASVNIFQLAHAAGFLLIFI